jgi:adenosylcobinamide-phosphate synthase
VRTEYHIAIAVLADLALGDPRWLPHPVRAFGWIAERVERLARCCIPNERLAGVFAVALLVVGAASAAGALIELAGRIHPIAADIVSIWVIYSAIAARDLASHAWNVFRPLSVGDLPNARLAVSKIVGRDVERLDESGVARAAIESVAESTVDGVTAPLFFALCFGPVGAVGYRAINTLDSMFGHLDGRYARFGWAAARLDDLANWIPARLTAPLVCLAAFLRGKRSVQAVAVLRRDGRKHASPNSGLPEAAMAGALGLQLGGVNFYDGEPMERPTLGDPIDTPRAVHVRDAVRLMFCTLGLFLGGGLAVRLGSMELWHAWRTCP